MENNNNTNKSQERFEKFVDYHNKLRSKRHVQGDKVYSDYDTMMGLSIIMIPISFIWISSFFGIVAITATILFLMLNNMDITKKE